MRLTHLPLTTLKEVPADAEIISHQLMLRAGLVRRLSSGLFTWMPLGFRVLRKVERIVREEMNRAGAIELLMPAVQPAELWQESGRWQQYGPELLRVKDRHQREFCRLDLPTEFRTTFPTDSATLRIFLDEGVVDVELATGRATVELVQHRAVIYAANVLHLNTPKKLWTWVADLYAVSLGLLAITGLFVLKGKTGITGRGAWLTAIGVAVPAFFLWLYL